jgi:signal transduction histidine kinase
MQYFFLILLLLITSVSAAYCTQERVPALDSMLQTLTDAEKLEFFHARKFLDYTRASSQHPVYLLEYRALAQKLGRKGYELEAEHFFIINQSDLSNISANESLTQYLALLRRTQANNITSLQPQILANLAMTALDGTHDIAFAFDYALQAVQSARAERDTTLLGLALNPVADAYLRSGNPESALPYCKESLVVRETFQKRNNLGQENLVWTLHHLGLIYEALHHHDSAFASMQRAVSIAQKADEALSGGFALKNLARLYLQRGDKQTAKQCLDEAILYSRRLDYTLTYQMQLLTDIAAVLRSLGFYHEALVEAEHALEVAKRAKARYSQSAALRECALAHAALGNTMEAFRFQEESRLLADSLAKLNTFRAITETEHRIKTSRENETLLIENLRRAEERNTAIILGIASVLVLGGVGGTLYFRNRARFTRRLLEESERTSRAVVQATFNGMEKERKRVGRELHDGVGTQLHLAGLKFSSTQEIIRTKQPEHYSTFMEATVSLSDAVVEVRRISENFLPTLLESSGLAVTLEDYIAKMGIVSPEILLNVKALRGKRFEAQHELSVYRLTQEIINNCLKHAKAQSLVLDFALEMRMKNNVQEEWLTLTAEDEGVGFHQETLQKKGLGLSTMQNRVHALGGTLEINSVVGQGTRIVAEIPLREISITA